MKVNLLIKFLFICISQIALSSSLLADGVKYPDEEWKGFDGKIVQRLQKIRELIGRGNKCKIAVHGEFVRSFKLNRSQYVPAALEAYLPKSVSCIADMSVNANTVNEKSGCALVSFDSGKGEYSTFFNSSFAMAMSKKACDSGGFEDLISMRGWWSADAYQNSSVEETIFTPSSYAEPWQFVLIYAESSKFVTWYSDAQKRGVAFVAKKRESDRKKEASETQQAIQRQKVKKAKANEDSEEDLSEEAQMQKDLERARKEKEEDAEGAKYQEEQDRKAQQENDRHAEELEKKMKTWYSRPLAERMSICKKKTGGGPNSDCGPQWYPAED
ncbi:MAG: hypothetical protein ABL958_15410 [Bdellovibrionia bacterium]